MNGILARWESKGGKYFVEITKDQWGYNYKGRQCAGSSFARTEEEAFKVIEARIAQGDFQADANKTPMRRVA